ncbi:SOS response-associated peptidase [Paenibacillus hexagrammi]|uniref:Abasic site processing protein n=1 Tax=Paenibacillus hexagrammi TaxID=2908839 RepID=A0ABY3SKR4_9BACL|nr:SOS response-associated peptidase [Paenibacillus sp. YPD9-1]UJF34063.1 SOS response-associated peptidase [Paenibacillus sp. YPD9-1]
MCTSISMLADISRLSTQFRIDRLLSYSSNRYEISPRQSLSAIVSNRKSERLLDEFRWGLMPFWAREAVCGDKESIFRNMAFDRLIRKQRCVIPCSGFYISQTAGKQTQWFRFNMRSGTFGIAGLYDVWRSPSGEELRTCMMLMTEANSLISPHHHSMPAILEEADIDAWLQPPVKEAAPLKSLLQPMDELRMVRSSLASEQEKLELQTDMGALA